MAAPGVGAGDAAEWAVKAVVGAMESRGQELEVGEFRAHALMLAPGVVCWPALAEHHTKTPGDWTGVPVPSAFHVRCRLVGQLVALP